METPRSLQKDVTTSLNIIAKRATGVLAACGIIAASAVDVLQMTSCAGLQGGFVQTTLVLKVQKQLQCFRIILLSNNRQRLQHIFTSDLVKLVRLPPQPLQLCKWDQLSITCLTFVRKKILFILVWTNVVCTVTSGPACTRLWGTRMQHTSLEYSIFSQFERTSNPNTKTFHCEQIISK